MIKAVLVVGIALLITRESISSLYSKPFKIGISKTAMLNVSSIENASTSTTAPTTTASISTTELTKMSTTPTTVVSTTSTSTTTVAAPSNTTNFTSPFPESTILQRQTSLTYFCGCDLKLQFCDVNCCCDIDCTNEMLKAFDCNEKYQSQHDFQYQQGLPSCKISDGWLCVLNDNAEDELPEVYTANAIPNRKYGWSGSFLVDEEHEKERQSYKTGDPVMLYNDQTEEVKPFDLPYSVLNPNCAVLAPIRHLIDFTRSCRSNLSPSEDFFKIMYEEIISLKLLKSRKSSLTSEPIIEPSHYVDINLHHCLQQSHTKTCQNLTNSTLAELNPSTCSTLEIIIQHNFTDLLRCDLYFICAAEEEGIDSSIWQHFHVKFIHHNETKSPRNIISGKWGYRTGYPVIQGSYIAINETSDETEKQLVIDYFHENSTKHNKIFLPVSEAGFCSSDISEQINFNENSLNRCFITLGNNSSSIILPDSNYTKICGNLQRIAFSYLINNNNFSGTYDTYVSELGSPLNISSNWIKVETKNYDPLQIIGSSFDSASNSFSCQNMILNVRYEFLTVRLSVHGIRHQNLIKSASLEFGKRVDLQLKLDEELKLPIHIAVMFYDVTNVKSGTTIISISSYVIVKLRITIIMLSFFLSFL